MSGSAEHYEKYIDKIPGFVIDRIWIKAKRGCNPARAAYHQDIQEAAERFSEEWLEEHRPTENEQSNLNPQTQFDSLSKRLEELERRQKMCIKKSFKEQKEKFVADYSTLLSSKRLVKIWDKTEAGPYQDAVDVYRTAEQKVKEQLQFNKTFKKGSQDLSDSEAFINTPAEQKEESPVDAKELLVSLNKKIDLIMEYLGV